MRKHAHTVVESTRSGNGDNRTGMHCVQWAKQYKPSPIGETIAARKCIFSSKRIFVNVPARQQVDSGSLTSELRISQLNTLSTLPKYGLPLADAKLLRRATHKLHITHYRGLSNSKKCHFRQCTHYATRSRLKSETWISMLHWKQLSCLLQFSKCDIQLQQCRVLHHFENS